MVYLLTVNTPPLSTLTHHVGCVSTHHLCRRHRIPKAQTSRSTRRVARRSFRKGPPILLMSALPMTVSHGQRAANHGPLRAWICEESRSLATPEPIRPPMGLPHWKPRLKATPTPHPFPHLNPAASGDWIEKNAHPHAAPEALPRVAPPFFPQTNPHLSQQPRKNVAIGSAIRGSQPDYPLRPRVSARPPFIQSGPPQETSPRVQFSY